MTCRHPIAATRILVVAAFGAAAAWPARADPAADLAVRGLAATCAACHGTDGRAVDSAEVPGLAGLPAAYLAEQMRGFRSGARPATVMQQIAKGYTDAQIDQLAAYFAARPR